MRTRVHLHTHIQRKDCVHVLFLLFFSFLYSFLSVFFTSSIVARKSYCFLRFSPPFRL